MLSQAWEVFERGGPVMWPLLGLWVVAVVLLIERVIFLVGTNRGGRVGSMRRVAGLMRAGDRAGAKAAAERVGGLYGRVGLALCGKERVDEALGAQLIEDVRPAVERFMPTLSTIITAAPLLGILGTVLGIIEGFDVVSAQQARVDLNALAAGIAEALITTGTGLAIALLTLFPYNALRVQVDRTLGRVEALVEGSKSDKP